MGVYTKKKKTKEGKKVSHVKPMHDPLYNACFSIVGALTLGPLRETQVWASRTTPLKNVRMPLDSPAAPLVVVSLRASR